MAKVKAKNNYINNKTFYAEMIKYVNSYNAAKEAGKEVPIPSNYIGQAISLIATNLAKKPNFSGYSFKEEMIGDAIENCFLYLYKFDPDKTNNPFAYFTQTCFFAFLRRIDKEKKQTYIKYKAMENSVIMNSLVEMPEEDHSHFSKMLSNVDIDKMAALSEKFEQKNKSKAKKAPVGVELFTEEDDEQV